MIEMLTELRQARCRNCKQPVTLYGSDLRLEPFWSHQDSGHVYCADAPLAEPNECAYGDACCPCQDGDPCHYEGERPMTPPTP